MSSHCGRYPACGCAKDMGTQCHLPEHMVKPVEKCDYCGRLAYKTNGEAKAICYNRAVSGNCVGVMTEKVEKQKQLPKVGRNDACPCGSGKKYKKCCIQ